MNRQKVKHGQFQLNVRENGIDAWLCEPGTAVIFLVMISEAIANGFWVDAPQN